MKPLEKRVSIKKVVKPKNQRHRNRILKEMVTNDHKLQLVESLFLEMLFEDNAFSYAELYESFVDRWHETIHFMTVAKQFKYTYPNKGYFCDMYKPIEEPAT
jgi:hypothetical protein